MLLNCAVQYRKTRNGKKFICDVYLLVAEMLLTHWHFTVDSVNRGVNILLTHLLVVVLRHMLAVFFNNRMADKHAH